jgi:tRNA-uridine aminocarboxypropyltransferase
MPSRRPSRNVAGARCASCHMRSSLCLCALVPRLELATRVVVLQHQRETYATTNTARLARLALPNSETRIRGLPGAPPASGGLAAEAPGELLVLYPDARAEVLDERLGAAVGRPVTLVVLDGSWRQAGRMIRREPGLEGARLVKLATPRPSRYRLRKSTKPDALCTLEAIASALGVLEGPEPRAQLEWLLAVMVERTLFSRGDLKADECVFELPVPVRAP